MPDQTRGRSAAAAEASRINGARSRGPRTTQGKQASSRNARKHGLRSAAPAASGDDAEWLRAVGSEFVSEADAAGGADHELVERVLTAALLMRRAGQLFAERAGQLAQAIDVNDRESRRPAGLTLRQIRSLLRERLRAGASVAELDAFIDACFDQRARAKAVSPSLDQLAADLQKIARYERWFRGQRDRALRRLCTPSSLRPL